MSGEIKVSKNHLINYYIYEKYISVGNVYIVDVDGALCHIFVVLLHPEEGSWNNIDIN